MYVQPQKLAQFCRYSIAIHSSYSPLLQIFQVQLPHQGGTHGAVEPTARALRFLGPAVWITGRRRSQGAQREKMQMLEKDAGKLG
jgi:hypothetical protein